MNNEIAIRQDTALTIEPEQGYWTDQQVAALRHMGVEDAGEGDLAVFFHRAKSTGLDPFSGQIHMIGRNSKNQRTNQWETKYTIQTGIDGYRLIGRRAARATGETISISAPEWAHEDGSWRPVWSPKWGQPVAARVTIKRNGEPFPGVALFDEYKQTRRDGQLTSMWAQRPAGQLAKCAEALAWRMAFPQDLAGLYTDAELQHADSAPRVEQAPAPQAAASDFITAEPVADEVTGEVVEDPPATPAQTNRMFALFGERADMPDGRTVEGRAYRLDYCGQVLGREVGSSKDLTADEVSRIIDALQADAPAQPADVDPFAQDGDDQ